MKRTHRGLSGSELKLIAMAAMTVDHLAWVVWPGYSRALPVIFLHILGRTAAPVFWFMAAEGYYHTHNLSIDFYSKIEYSISKHGKNPFTDDLYPHLEQLL